MSIKNNFKVSNNTDVITKFKKYIDKNDCPEVLVDLSNASIFDAVKFVVISSTYHYGKYPNGKIKCKVQSEDVKEFISNFTTYNLEFV